MIFCLTFEKGRSDDEQNEQVLAGLITDSEIQYTYGFRNFVSLVCMTGNEKTGAKGETGGAPFAKITTPILLHSPRTNIQIGPVYKMPNLWTTAVMVLLASDLSQNGHQNRRVISMLNGGLK